MNTHKQHQFANGAKSNYNQLLKINMKAKRKSRTIQLAEMDWNWYYSY